MRLRLSRSAKRLPLSAFLVVLAGCASLAIRDHDAAAIKVAKFTARVPLCIVTLYASEIEIKCRGGVYSPQQCANAWRAYSAAFASNQRRADSYQGCCSYHQGIFGCEYVTNQIVCNDGQYSPTCTCPLVNGSVDYLALSRVSLSCCTLNGGVLGCDYRMQRIICADHQYAPCACP